MTIRDDRLAMATQILCALIQRNQGLEERWPQLAIKKADELIAHALISRPSSRPTRR